MNPYRRSIYVPLLANFANSYIISNNDGYSAVTWYIDGTWVISNG